MARKFKIKKHLKHVLTDLNQFSLRQPLGRGTIVYLPFRVGQSTKANMYADLHDKPRKSVVRRRRYRSRIKQAKRRGRRIMNPSGYYTVRKGDSLWSVAKKNGISLDTLIVSNLNILNKRQIMPGDKLIVR